MNRRKRQRRYVNLPTRRQSVAALLLGLLTSFVVAWFCEWKVDLPEIHQASAVAQASALGTRRTVFMPLEESKLELLEPGWIGREGREGILEVLSYGWPIPCVRTTILAQSRPVPSPLYWIPSSGLARWVKTPMASTPGGAKREPSAGPAELRPFSLDELRRLESMLRSRQVTNPLSRTFSVKIDGAFVVHNKAKPGSVVVLPWRPLVPALLGNTVIYAFVWLAFFGLLIQVRSSRRAKRGLCIQCAYPIGMASSTTCPECGNPIAQSQSDLAS